MAKRRKAKKSSYRRRRRMSGIGKLNVAGIGTQVLGIAAGAAGAAILAKNVFPTMNAKVKAAIQIGAGIALPAFLLKNKMGEALGSGMIAVGAVNILQSMNVISGIGEDALLLPVSMAGDDLSVVAGGDDDDDSYAMSGDDLSVVAGIEDGEEE